MTIKIKTIGGNTYDLVFPHAYTYAHTHTHTHRHMHTSHMNTYLYRRRLTQIGKSIKGVNEETMG